MREVVNKPQVNVKDNVGEEDEDEQEAYRYIVQGRDPSLFFIFLSSMFQNGRPVGKVSSGGRKF